MSDSNGISAQGCIIKMNGTAIEELRDITPPALTRKALEMTTHNSSDDQFNVGIRRHGELSFLVNWIPSGEGSSHDLLLDSWASGTKELWEVDFPDGVTWSFSGYVVNIAPKEPVDGVQEANISVRSTGIHVFSI